MDANAVFSALGAIEFRHGSADDCDGFVCDFCGCGLTGADCPNGFVCDDDIVKFVFVDAVECTLGLTHKNFFNLAAFSLFESFAYANDGFKTCRKSCLCASIDGLIGFAEVLTTLGVTDDDVFHAEFDKHFCGDFTGECAFFRPVHVFCADFDVCALGHFDCRCKIGVRRADDDVALCILNKRSKVGDKCLCIGDCVVHFPVACDDWFSHNNL